MTLLDGTAQRLNSLTSDPRTHLSINVHKCQCVTAQEKTLISNIQVIRNTEVAGVASSLRPACLSLSHARDWVSPSLALGVPRPSRSPEVNFSRCRARNRNTSPSPCPPSAPSLPAPQPPCPSPSHPLLHRRLPRPPFIGQKS